MCDAQRARVPCECPKPSFNDSKIPQNTQQKFSPACNSIPLVKFGSGTRDQRQRLAMAMLPEDSAKPKGGVPLEHVGANKLPPLKEMPLRRDVLRLTQIR